MFNTKLSAPTLGALCAMIAAVMFSLNDVAIKFLSGGYALHEIVLIRSVIGLLILMVCFYPFMGGRAILKTNRLGMHILRSFMVVFANMTFFVGLASLPLAVCVAIFFVAPLMITIFSIVFLGETVGIRRWLAVCVGFVGVAILVRPGSETFQIAAILPVFAAAFYAAIHIITRKIGSTESAATMTFYVQVVFIVVCVAIGLAIGDGRFGDTDDPSLRFMFRAWVWPDMADALPLIFIGFAVAFGGYFISQAYRVAEAGFIAPFEYLALPLSVLWGYLVFAEVPDMISVIGIVLIVGSGLFTLARERTQNDVPASQSPRYRR